MSLFRKIMYLISADIRNSKFMDIEHNAVDRFTLGLHDCVFILFFGLAILFYGDVWLFDGEVSAALIDWLHVHPGNKKYLSQDSIKMFYVFGSFASLAIGVFAAIYFYIGHGSDIDRYNLHHKLICNNLLVTTIRGMILAPLGTAALIGGGYLLTITIPSVFFLDRIPGFLLIQLFLVLKIQALIAMAACGTFLLFFPYKLHPKGWIKRKMYQRK